MIDSHLTILTCTHFEGAGNRGKQPDGSAKTREAKLCTIWRPNLAMKKAIRSVTLAPSVILPPSNRPPIETPMKHHPHSRNGFLAYKTTSPRTGQSDVVRNSMTDVLTPFYVPYVAIASTARRYVSASAISAPTGIGCAIRNLRRSTCAPLLPLSNRVASSSSPPGSKAPECIGAYPEPTPFSHFDALA